MIGFYKPEEVSNSHSAICSVLKQKSLIEQSGESLPLAPGSTLQPTFD